MTPKCAAILTGPDTYLDHLGVLAYLLDIPLIVTELDTLETAKHFYPQISCEHIPMSDLSVGFLTEHFDAIFETGKFWSAELKPSIACFSAKPLRFVYCPHGNSDKGHLATNHVAQDISLVYGDHMVDLLTKTGAKNSIRTLVRTGNYRALFYEKYQDFYRGLTREVLGGKLLPNRPTILYAPTWEDKENPTSFFAKTQDVVERLAPSWNLLIKLHPFLAEHYPAKTHRILGLYDQVPGVCFLENFPPIYPLLDLADVYLGDYSSIGYDFLKQNKPLYFFPGKEQCSLNSTIHSCGFLVPEGARLDQFLTNTLLENQEEKKLMREQVYRYAFGDKTDIPSLKKSLFSALAS